MTEQAISLTVHGLVQGVGFRYTAAQLARQHHLVGFAKNNADGTVSLVVQGSTAMVANFIEAIKDPPASWIHVTSVDQQTIALQPLEKFDIY